MSAASRAAAGAAQLLSRLPQVVPELVRALRQVPVLPLVSGWVGWARARRAPTLTQHHVVSRQHVRLDQDGSGGVRRAGAQQRQARRFTTPLTPHRCRAVQYQKRVIQDGTEAYRHRCATRIQVRGHVLCVVARCRMRREHASFALHRACGLLPRSLPSRLSISPSTHDSPRFPSFLFCSGQGSAAALLFRRSRFGVGCCGLSC